MSPVFAGGVYVLAMSFVPTKVRMNAQHKDRVQSDLHWYWFWKIEVWEILVASLWLLWSWELVSELVGFVLRVLFEDDLIVHAREEHRSCKMM
jgi:hypothetical protein